MGYTKISFYTVGLSYGSVKRFSEASCFLVRPDLWGEAFRCESSGGFRAQRLQAPRVRRDGARGALWLARFAVLGQDARHAPVRVGARSEDFSTSG